MEVANIDIEPAISSKISEVDFSNLTFGKYFSDHMFIMEYKNGAWSTPKIKEYGKIGISPALAAVHYGQAVFEGMKAYKNEAGEIALFRPMDNIRRLNISAERMCMPQIPEDIFLEGLKQLVLIDQEWIPTTFGHSLYIRPVYFGSEPLIGVRPADEYTFVIFTSPVGNYYAEPVKVLIETEYSRAMKGGVGYAKAAGNYGASLYPSKLAKDKGYHQLLWTDAKEHKYFEESGTMNLMFQIGDTLVTPPVGETILRGITRDSVVQLARDLGMKVEERRILVEEIIAAHNHGELKDGFGIGTAATISHFELIGYKGKDYYLPPIEERKYSTTLLQTLKQLRVGQVEDTHNWLIHLN